MIAVRNLLRHKAYSLINILGLAIGLGCAILILLYVQFEMSFDRFQENSDRIYRVVRETRTQDGSVTASGGTSGPLAPALLKDFPEVEAITRFMSRESWVKIEDRGFDQWGYMVDQQFLDVFRFPLLLGETRTVLENPYSVVITESMAERFFAGEDPVGKVITMDHVHVKGDFTVTGVALDPPDHSSIRFDFLVSPTSHEEVQRYLNNWQSTYFVRPF